MTEPVPAIGRGASGEINGGTWRNIVVACRFIT
jgi:hypothetical protein